MKILDYLIGEIETVWSEIATKWKHKCLEIKDVDTDILFVNAILYTPATKEYIYPLASITTISDRQKSLLYW